MDSSIFLPVLGGAVLVALFIGAKTCPLKVKVRGLFAQIWWELKWAIAFAVIVVVLFLILGIIGKASG